MLQIAQVDQITGLRRHGPFQHAQRHANSLEAFHLPGNHQQKKLSGGHILLGNQHPAGHIAFVDQSIGELCLQGLDACHIQAGTFRLAHRFLEPAAKKDRRIIEGFQSNSVDLETTDRRCGGVRHGQAQPGLVTGQLHLFQLLLLTLAFLLLQAIEHALLCIRCRPGSTRHQAQHHSATA